MQKIYPASPIQVSHFCAHFQVSDWGTRSISDLEAVLVVGGEHFEIEGQLLLVEDVFSIRQLDALLLNVVSQHSGVDCQW